MAAFQAADAGSIPAARIKFWQKEKRFFCASKKNVTHCQAILVRGFLAAS